MSQLFTGEDIHNAYIAVVPHSAKPWDEVPAQARHLYEQMATSLNCQEAIIRAWRELQAVPSYAQRYQRVAQLATTQEE
jgi:hypothetical protein